MKPFVQRSVIAGLTAFLSLAAGTSAGLAMADEPTGAEPAHPELTFELRAEVPFAVPEGPMEPRYDAIPGPELERGAPTPGIPSFSGSIRADGKNYRYTLVGTSPFVKGAKNVTIPIQIIPVRFHFDDGNVFDPTAPNICASYTNPQAPITLFMQSPIVNTYNYGEGPKLFNEEVRRLEFWALTGAPGAINPNYSLKIAAKVLPVIDVKATGFPTQSGHCGQLGLIEENYWDNFVRTTLYPQLVKLGVNPTTFPFFLFEDVVMFDGTKGNCCVLGFHTAFQVGRAVQTYGVGEYDMSHYFGATSDVAVIAHEIGEWYDDPFVNNPTPSWGHTGQVSGCQGDLEVGDPLSGHVHSFTMPNGYTYHPQELAFFSWFFNQVPSLGFDGWYSSGGTFKAPAPLCH